MPRRSLQGLGRDTILSLYSMYSVSRPHLDNSRGHDESFDVVSIYPLRLSMTLWRRRYDNREG